MSAIANQQEEKNRRIGAITSFMLHALLILILFVSFLTFPDPPPGQSGILVALGEPDVGMGDERPKASTTDTEEQPEPVVEEEPDTAPEPEEEEPEPVKEVEKPVKKPEPSKKVNTDDNSKELALKRKKEEERKKQEAEKRKKERDAEAKKKRDAEAKKKAAADAAKKKAAEEERKRAEAEAKKKADYEKTKNQIGDLFGGSGQGNTGKPGSQGDPDGDPNSDVLDGISTGSGKIGGGLGNRGGRGPALTDSSQETGRVVVKVCVDRKGRVSSAKFTQRGSTTSSSRLIKLAEANARRYTFKAGDIDKQCGTITYDFKVK